MTEQDAPSVININITLQIDVSQYNLTGMALEQAAVDMERSGRKIAAMLLDQGQGELHYSFD